MGFRQASGIVCAGIAAAALCSASPAGAAPGDIDTGFGDGGLLIVDASPATDETIASMSRAADGQIIGLGTEETRKYESPIVTRFDRSGRLDAEFGDGGKLLLDQFDEVEPYMGVGTAPDGTITFFTWIREFAILNEDGSVKHFGPIGSDSDEDFPRTLEPRPDGRFVVAGQHFDDYDPMIRGYLPSGQPDPAFGQAGVADLSGIETDDFNDIALRPDGGLVAIGEACCSSDGDHPLISLVAIDPNGTLDSDFGGGDGEVVIDPGPDSYANPGTLAVAADGEVTGVMYTNGAKVFRLDAAGKFDDSFGGNGFFRIPHGRGDSEYVNRILLQRDGRVLLSVSRDFGSGLRMLNANGSPDESFGGGDGVVYSNRWLPSTAIQVGKRVIVAGSDLAFEHSELRAFTLASGPAGRGNADGDHLDDAEDRCPESAASNRDGCPRTGRRVRLDHRPGRFTVHVYDGGYRGFDCDELGRVRLDLLRQGKRPKLIGSAPTGSGHYGAIRIGSWRPHGRFVATALPVEQKNGLGVCRRARSEVLEIPVHRDPDEDH